MCEINLTLEGKTLHNFNSKYSGIKIIQRFKLLVRIVLNLEPGRKFKRRKKKCFIKIRCRY